MKDHKSSDSHTTFLLGMILSMMCWGFSWASGKVLGVYSDPLTISFLRFALTFVSLYVVLLLIKLPLKIKTLGLKYLVIAAVFITLYNYFFFKGLSLGKAGAGGVLVTTLNPIISYAIMLMMTWRKPTRNETIGLILGLIAGVILLKLYANLDTFVEPGNIYYLLASISWALLSLFTSKSSRYGSPISFSFWMYGISMVFLFLLADKGAALSLLSKGDYKFWGNLFFSATITTSFASTFYFMATSKIGASKASSFIFLVPFSAAMGSWIFLNEVPLIHTIIGGVLGIAAVYILNKKRTTS